MRIAVVHPYPVHQKAVGGVSRVYELVRFLAARHHRVTVLTHASTEGPAGGDAELARLGVVQKAFPRREATLVRKLAWGFDALPYYVRHNENASLAGALAAMDAQEPFDVVHLELGYMAPFLSSVGPQAIRVLAEQEIMSLAVARLRRVPWRDRTGYERLAPLMAAKCARFERDTLRIFDLVYGITPADRDFLQAMSGRPAAILPHVVAASRFSSPVADDRSPDRVIFVGNFHHRPNVHAAAWFIEHVWPKVLALHPPARFTIVGPGLIERVKQRFSASGADVAGYAPDLAACYRNAGVVVAPMHSGGGMRGKVLEAFASGCAVVGTPTSFEGIAAVSGKHCVAASDPESFAQAVVRYAVTPTLRIAHGGAARHLVEERYDAPVVFARLEADLEAAVMERQPISRHRTSA